MNSDPHSNRYSLSPVALTRAVWRMDADTVREDADSRVLLLKQRMEALKKRREARAVLEAPAEKAAQRRRRAGR